MSGKILNVGPGVALPLSVVTSKAAILAMTGQGKTYLAKVIAEEMLNHGAQIVVGDYLGVWWGLTSSASGKAAGKNVVVFGGDHADVPLNENAGGAIADLVVNERVSAVLDVSGFEDDAPKIRFMTAFARRLFHRNKRPLHFFLDEADEFVPQSPQREQIQMLAVLKRIWQRGRIKGIGGTIISQRSAVVHKTLLSQSEMLIALRTVAPQDRDALQAWFDSWGTEEQVSTFEKTISNLPQYHAWFWSPRHKLFVQGKARKLETFDSSATPDIDHGELVEPTKRTAHDIKRFGSEIEKLAKEAAKEDPDLLLRENVKLERDAAHYREQFEIAKKRIAILEERERKKVKANTVVRDKPVKVPAVSKPTLREIAKTRKALANTATAITTALRDTATAVAADAEAVIRRLDRELERAERLGSTVQDRLSRAAETAGAALEGMAAAVPAAVVETAGSAGRETRTATNGTGGGGKVSGGRGRILAALAQHGKMKPGRIRVLGGISSLDTLWTYLRQMKRSEWVREDGGEYAITRAGLDALGEYTPLPTGRALIDYWRNELGDGGKGKIFAALLSKRTYAFPDEELMKAAGINSSDTFNTYIRQLRVLGLAERSGKFWMIASDFADL